MKNEETALAPRSVTVGANRMDAEEKRQVALRLAPFWSVFEKFWSAGDIVFDTSIPTAAIEFEPHNGDAIRFVINPNMWYSLTERQQNMIVCHEMLHVIFCHGFRMVTVPRNMQQICNIALDIVVNETLVASYGFKYEDDIFLNADGKYEIDPKSGKPITSCFVHTVFEGQNPLPPKDRDFTYYMNRLVQDIKRYKSMSLMLVEGPTDGDGHDGLESFMDQGVGDGWEGTISKQMNDGEKNQMKQLTEKELKDKGEKEAYAKQAGKMPGNFFYQAIGGSWAKKKWESVIKEWKMKTLGAGESYHWLKTDRRLAMLPAGNTYLPCEDENDRVVDRKIEVWVFQDTSGSCAHLAERFFKAAESLHLNTAFKVRLFCFDTQVYETDFVSKKLYGFGGTSFTCIERAIQSKRNGGAYPDAVFVITDGYGDNVTPERPDRWYWFLSEKYEVCIPQRSPKFMLQDFE